MKGRLFFHREKRILVFPRGRTIVRGLRYRSFEKMASRSVVKACGKKKDGSGPSYYRHAAFFPRFLDIGEEWFLAVEPTYHFTVDGFEEYPFDAERLSGIKLLENNESVRSHIGLWRAVLTQEADLLRSEYPFLRFEPAPSLSCRFGVPDDAWRKHESEEVTERFDEAQRDLFE